MTSIAVSSRKAPIQQERELHQDEHLPRPEPQAAEEEALDSRAHRPEAVEHRAEAERGEDDPHEHAAHSRGSCATSASQDLEGEPGAGGEPLRSPRSRPTAELSTRLV